MNWFKCLVERTYVAAAFAEVGEWQAAEELSREVDRRYQRERAEDRKPAEKKPRPRLNLR
jgi:hypothetical protein